VFAPKVRHITYSLGQRPRSDGTVKGFSAESAIQRQHGFHRRNQLKRAFSACLRAGSNSACGKVISLTPQL
jgi:hypothetical protein